MIWNISAGPLQNWHCYGGSYSHKIPYNTVGFSVYNRQVLCLPTPGRKICQKHTVNATFCAPDRSVYTMFFIDFARRCCAGQHRRKSVLARSHETRRFVNPCGQCHTVYSRKILLASSQKPMVNGGYLGASSSDRPRVRADTIGIGARRQ